MKLIDEYQISCWAYFQCLNGNDTKEMRDLITNSWSCYLYCKNIKDIEEMWKKIKDSKSAFDYCYHIKDRIEVRKYIKDILHLRILYFRGKKEYETYK